MRTIDLIGEPLEWAAATCEGFTLTTDGISMLLERGKEMRVLGPHNSPLSYSPSTNWAQGGLIIEREHMLVGPSAGHRPVGIRWMALRMGVLDKDSHRHTGPTPLIAAMRCYVASRLGDEIEVPKLLLARASTYAALQAATPGSGPAFPAEVDSGEPVPDEPNSDEPVDRPRG